MDKNYTAGWMSESVVPQAHAKPIHKPLPEPAPMPTFPVLDLPEEPCDDEMVLVMSYVKKQSWSQTYEADTALERGTIFPELDLPFVGEGACRRD